MARLSMVEAINATLHEQMSKDDRVVVLGEDVGVDGGVFRATVGLIDKFGPERVIDCRGSNWNGNLRHASHCGDTVRRLHVQGV
jgi:hypothetical protein